jgi:hypothetical protein
MMIKPISPFRAVVPGSAYPKNFTVDDEFEADSIEAKAALDLGCLSDEDAATVRKALEVAAKPKAKAKGAAPENKAGGA